MAGSPCRGLRIRATRDVRLSALPIALILTLSVAIQTWAQADLGTIEPGKLIVAFNGDMPMTSLRNGELVGTDGEMMTLIANHLGLQIVPQQMDWDAEIASTTEGRVDVMLGAVGWTAERSQVMILSDPIYYFGVLLAQKTETSYHSFADMAGKRVGTVTGFSLVPELKRVPGISAVSLYDTSDAVMRDLVVGRLDIAILDPPLVALAIKQHPEWDLHQLPLAPDPAYPVMSTTYNATIGMRKDATVLAAAINVEIGKLWAGCQNQQIMAKYGVTDASFFTPPAPNPRAGVDRPADLVSPTLNPACDASGAQGT